MAANALGAPAGAQGCGVQSATGGACPVLVTSIRSGGGAFESSDGRLSGGKPGALPVLYTTSGIRAP